MPPDSDNTRAAQAGLELPAFLSTPRGRAVAGAVAIFAFTVIAYLPALLQGGFIWDDDMYVTNNIALRSLAGLRDIWFKLGTTPQYYPLVFTSFWIEFQIWGKAAMGYHAVNILLHATSAVLLWRILRRFNVPAAWMAAAIFALHPVHVESVAWITERKNVLSGLLYLTSLWCYMRFAPFELAPAKQPRRWKFYAFALLAYIGALLSKTVTATLPAAILLLIWWRRRDNKLGSADVVPLVPMFVLGIGLGAITAYMEREHVGAAGSDWDFTFIDRVLIAGRAVWFYFSKLIWPHNLTFIYERSQVDSGSAWQYAFPIAAVVLLIVLWALRRRIGKGPLVAALYFGGTLFPALGFVNVYPMLFSFVADHFQYLASLGPIVLLSACGALLLRRARVMVQRVAAAFVLLLLGAVTLLQTFIYEDVITLWTDTINKNPKAWIAYDNLSQAHGERGDFQLAAALALASLDLRPQNSVALNNLGLAMESLGLPEKAIEHYERALDITPRRVLARLNLAGLLFRRNDLEGAERHYRIAIEHFPEFAEAHYNYSVFLATVGRMEEAWEHCQIALDLTPHDADIRTMYAYLMHKQGYVQEAIAELQATLRDKPQHERARMLLQNFLAEQPN